MDPPAEEDAAMVAALEDDDGFGGSDDGFGDFEEAGSFAGAEEDIPGSTGDAAGMATPTVLIPGLAVASLHKLGARSSLPRTCFDRLWWQVHPPLIYQHHQMRGLGPLRRRQQNTLPLLRSQQSAGLPAKGRSSLCQEAAWPSQTCSWPAKMSTAKWWVDITTVGG
jgi:hypothetical protein